MIVAPPKATHKRGATHLAICNKFDKNKFIDIVLNSVCSLILRRNTEKQKKMVDSSCAEPSSPIMHYVGRFYAHLGRNSIAQMTSSDGSSTIGLNKLIQKSVLRGSRRTQKTKREFN